MVFCQHVVNMMDWLIGRPLHVACLENNATFVKERLKEYTESQVNERNLWGYTALHAAAWAGHVNIVNDLISAGAKINKADNLLNLTPLWCASRSGHVDVILALLRNGADIHTAPDCGQDTPLHTAARFTWPEAVQALLENEANVNATDCEGNTPLHYICQKMAQGQYKQTECYAVCRLLMSYGANINTRNNAGLTCMHVVKHKRLVKCNLLRFHEDSKRTQHEPMEQGHAEFSELPLNKKNIEKTSEKQLHDLERKVVLLNDKLCLIDKMCSDVPSTMQTHLEQQIKDALQTYARDVSVDIVRDNLVTEEKVAFALDRSRRHDNVLAVMQDRMSNIEKRQIIFKDEITTTRETLAQLKEEALNKRRASAPPVVSLESNKWVPVFQLVSKLIGLKWDDLYRALVKHHVQNLLEIEAMISHLQDLHPRNLYRQAYSSLVKASLVCGELFTKQYLMSCLVDIGKNDTAMKVQSLNCST